MTINLDELRKRAELPNALHGCSSDPCGSVVCQTARDRDELLSRLEQAEQDRVKLRNRLDAMRRQRDGYQNQLRKTEQQVQRVREACESDSYDMHKDYGNGELVVPVDSIMNALDGDTRG